MERILEFAGRMATTLGWLAGAAARCVAPSPEEELAWRRDPLSHPVLDAMTERELGDLPLHPRRIARGACPAC